MVGPTARRAVDGAVANLAPGAQQRAVGPSSPVPSASRSAAEEDRHAGDR